MKHKWSLYYRPDWYLVYNSEKSSAALCRVKRSLYPAMALKQNEREVSLLTVRYGLYVGLVLTFSICNVLSPMCQKVACF